jgi:L-rhamnose isomerase
LKSSKIVLDYLIETTNFEEKESFVDRLTELAESYESIPEKVHEAYQTLTEYEMWEIIRKLAVEGKRRSK